MTGYTQREIRDSAVKELIDLILVNGVNRLRPKWLWYKEANDTFCNNN